jgi:threonyl-tRNA synthetase
MPHLFIRAIQGSSFWMPASPFVYEALKSFLNCPHREDDEYVYTNINTEDGIFEFEFMNYNYGVERLWKIRFDEKEYMLRYMN